MLTVFQRVVLQERLSALQLSEEELNNIVALQILTLIGQIQTQEEERLAALDVSSTNLTEIQSKCPRLRHVCVHVTCVPAAAL